MNDVKVSGEPVAEDAAVLERLAEYLYEATTVNVVAEWEDVRDGESGAWVRGLAAGCLAVVRAGEVA